MSIIAVLSSLFIVMLVGFVLGKIKLFDDDSRKALSRFVFYVATSALIIESIATIKVSELKQLPQFITINTFFYAVAYIGLYLVLRMIKASYKKGASVLYAGTVANTIYLGLPVIRALYGAEGVLFAVAIFTIPSAVSDVVDFYILSKWRKGKVSLLAVLKDFIANPIVASTFIGIILLALRAQLPDYISSSLNLLGNSATGVALFAMGLFLSTTSWKNFKIGQASVATAIKLILMPTLALLTGRLFGLHGTALSVMVLMAAMPSAIFCMIVATEYGFDEHVTADTILLSSVLFVLSSLFWIHVLR